MICYGVNREGKHIYKNEIHFSTINRLVQIDDSICNHLFSLIRDFEKRLRNALLLAICENYKNSEYKDKYGTIYEKDSNSFIKNLDRENINQIKEDKLLVLGPNFKYRLNSENNFVLDDKKQLEKKANLLAKIKTIGTEKDQDDFKTNQLIIRAIKAQKVAPFWLVGSVLNYGELQILFSMQSKETQGKVIENIFSSDPVDKKKIFKFQGYLEIIRRLRNTVNHYLPIFPVLLEQKVKTKNLSESKILKTIEMLKRVNCCEVELPFQKIPYIEFDEKGYFFDLPKTNYNEAKFELLNRIIETLNQ